MRGGVGADPDHVALPAEEEEDAPDLGSGRYGSLDYIILD